VVGPELVAPDQAALETEPDSSGGEMTQPNRVEPVRVIVPLADWEEVRRRQERTRALIEHLRKAQERLERAVDRVIRPE
jgi:hypothetical protein